MDAWVQCNISGVLFYLSIPKSLTQAGTIQIATPNFMKPRPHVAAHDEFNAFDLSLDERRAIVFLLAQSDVGAFQRVRHFSLVKSFNDPA